MSALPWNWETKVADFVKPGDAVLTLRPEGPLFTVGHEVPLPYPDDSFQVVLSRGAPCDFAEVRRVLKPGGFLLTECVGGEDSRALAEFLTPGSRPATDLNLENQLPLLKAAGFRAMYRDQAYPARAFADLRELLAYIRQYPEKFPGFSEDAAAPRLALLQGRPVEITEHLFLLIGKKQ